jgi:hypothetical protein
MHGENFDLGKGLTLEFFSFLFLNYFFQHFPFVCDVERGRSTEEEEVDGEGVRLTQTFLSGTAEDLIRILNINTGMFRSRSNYCKEKKVIVMKSCHGAA